MDERAECGGDLGLGRVGARCNAHGHPVWESVMNGWKAFRGNANWHVIDFSKNPQRLIATFHGVECDAEFNAKMCAQVHEMAFQLMQDLGHFDALKIEGQLLKDKKQLKQEVAMAEVYIKPIVRVLLDAGVDVAPEFEVRNP